LEEFEKSGDAFGHLQFRRSLERQQKDKSKPDQRLAHLDTTRLPFTEKGQARKRMAAKPKDVGHPGKDGDHVPGSNQAQADICRDAGRLFTP
jgi:hypothetical protein